MPLLSVRVVPVGTSRYVHRGPENLLRITAGAPFLRVLAGDPCVVSNPDDPTERCVAAHLVEALVVPLNRIYH